MNRDCLEVSVVVQLRWFVCVNLICSACGGKVDAPPPAVAVKESPPSPAPAVCHVVDQGVRDESDENGPLIAVWADLEMPTTLSESELFSALIDAHDAQLARATEQRRDLINANRVIVMIRAYPSYALQRRGEFWIGMLLRDRKPPQQGITAIQKAGLDSSAKEIQDGPLEVLKRRKWEFAGISMAIRHNALGMLRRPRERYGLSEERRREIFTASFGDHPDLDARAKQFGVSNEPDEKLIEAQRALSAEYNGTGRGFTGGYEGRPPSVMILIGMEGLFKNWPSRFKK